MIMRNKVIRVDSRAQLLNLANELGVRDDWHEPDEQDLKIECRGNNFDNAGFWPERHAVTQDGVPWVLEHYILLKKDGAPVAAVNIALLFAWATGFENKAEERLRKIKAALKPGIEDEDLTTAEKRILKILEEVE